MDTIFVENVSKRYRIGSAMYKTIREDISGIFSKFFKCTIGNKEIHKKRGFIWALKDVSFSVKKGEVIGIIGSNGAGKSTILKLLSNVTIPTRGNVKVNGKTSALIELGTGFHPELTGRENVFLYGSIMGMGKNEIKMKFEQIMEFSEIEEFIETPIKRYSSGMYARLGFSVAIHVEPQILLVDEVLAVGDWAFQQKCFNKMHEISKNGTTVVFVSHNMEAIRRLCKRTIFLNSGKLKFDGETATAIDLYYDQFFKNQIDYDCDNEKKAEIINSELTDIDGIKKNNFIAGDKAIFKYLVKFNTKIIAPEFGFFIKRPDNIQVISTGSRDLGIVVEKCVNGSILEIKFEFTVNLLRGIYNIGAEVRDKAFKNYYDMVVRAATIVVYEDYSHGGTSHLEPYLDIKEIRH